MPRCGWVTPTILTGDNPRTATDIAASLGTEFRAEMLPEDKLTAIREMAAADGVMLVGDGLNDAPALKQSSVGVAMGSGTDLALETADAAILRDRITDIPVQIRPARATMSKLRQNVALALGLKADPLVTALILIDSERDTAQVLADCVAYFDLRITGLTDAPTDIARAAADFRVTYSRVPRDDGDYTMNHTAGVFLFARDGRFVSIIDFHEDRRFALPKIRRALS